MIDDTAATGEPGAAPENSAAPGNSAAPESEQPETGERIAFCQQCGKGLTAETVRRAGSAVYCEPCLVARLEGQPTGTGPATGPAATGSGSTGWTSVNTPPPNPGPTVQPAPGPVPVSPVPVSNEPSPWLAALLGIIPGVGAAYNGQYAKGLAHLVIFVVLDSLSNNVNGVSGLIGLLVLAWVIYQIVDAYHTAKARRDGTPLPNPFGLNDIGDRMGFGRNWPGSASRPVTSATTAGWATATPGAGPSTSPQGPNWSGPNWSGYVPPTNFGANAPPPPPQPGAYASAPPSNTGWTQSPYANTYGGDPWHNPTGAPPPPPIPPLPVRRFPIGAAWLIALGLIFLMANLNGSWKLGGSWAVAIILAALGTFLLFRRVEMVRAWSRVAGDSDVNDYGITSQLLCQLRGPIMLLVLALLFALQAAGIRTLGQTWGVLLIALGALLILERTAGRNNWVPMGVPPGATVPPANAPRPGPAGPARKDGQ